MRKHTLALRRVNLTRLLSLIVLTLAMAGLSNLALAADTAGTVVIASGGVFAEAAGQKPRELKRRSPVYVGDTIRTDATGKAQIRLADGELLDLRPETELLIEKLTADSPNKEGNANFKTLIKGGFRAITGSVGGDQYKVSTPVATIGIRGTSYSLMLPGQGDPGLYAAVYRGGIAIENEAGNLELGAGKGFNYAYVANAQTPPQGLLQAPIDFNDGLDDGAVPDEDGGSSDGTGGSSGGSGDSGGETTNTAATGGSSSGEGDSPTGSSGTSATSSGDSGASTASSDSTSVDGFGGTRTTSTSGSTGTTTTTTTSTTPTTSTTTSTLETGTPVIEPTTPTTPGIHTGQAAVWIGSSVTSATSAAGTGGQPTFAMSGGTLSQGSAPADVPSSHGTYQISWGAWNATASTPATLTAADGSTQSITETVHWVSMVPADPLVVASQTGTVTYSLDTLHAHSSLVGDFSLTGGASTSSVANCGVSLTVNFANASVSGLMDLTLQGGNRVDLWQVQMSGSFSGSALALSTGGTYTQHDLGYNGQTLQAAISGNTVLNFVGSSAQGIAGGISLNATTGHGHESLNGILILSR